MLIGVSTHIHVRSPLDGRLLRRLKEAGFETVELYANPPHWPHYDRAASRREIAEVCLDIDLPINSVHSPFFRSLDEARAGRWLSLSGRDPDTRREAVARAAESLAVAEHAPVGCSVVHLGAPGEAEDAGTFERLHRSLEELLPAARELGVAVALENITNDFSRGHRIADFLAESGLEGLGCCYDCGHAAIYGRTVEELEEMAPRLLSTHIHDTTGGLDNHLMPFDGEIDWPALAAALAATGYDGALVVETKDGDSEPATITESAEAARRLRGMIERAGERREEDYAGQKRQ